VSAQATPLAISTQKSWMIELRFSLVGNDDLSISPIVTGLNLVIIGSYRYILGAFCMEKFAGSRGSVRQYQMHQDLE
jgi:hypothetical protein